MGRQVEIALEMFIGETPDKADSVAFSERAAFGRIVREHAPVLFALASRLAADSADAEDLVQETLLRAWKGIRSFRGDSKIRTWLYRILLNASRDLARRRRPVRLLRDSRTGHASDSAHGLAHHDLPAHGLARRDFLARVLDAIHGLPRRQRETLLLRARGGLSHKEISEVLGIRPGVVKLTLVNVRRKLAARFGREAAEWGIR